ncbi:MAG TPA: hypothetical protein DCK93_10930, partial [Blastocatellia bacterium]|nr:hypothetical protein [Blastocatellia bacterium]
MELVELNPSFLVSLPFSAAALLWQDGAGILRRIWSYISYPLPFFNDRVSVGRVVIGIAVLLL